MSAVTLRPASWRDCWRLWRWRNHPTTRAMMRETDSIGLIEHLYWFAVSRQVTTRFVFIAEANGRPIGSARLDFHADWQTAECDIIVAPHERGHGYAPSILRWLVIAATAGKATRLIATVRMENRASRRAFKSAGFRTVDTERGWLVMERRCA